MKLQNLIRQRMHALPETWHVLWGNASLLFFASQIGAALNFLTSTFLVQGGLSQNELGAVEPVTRLASFGAIPLAVAGMVAVKYLSGYHAVGAYGRIKTLLRDMMIVGLVSSAAFVAFLCLSFKWFGVRMNVESPHLLPALCSLAVLSCWQPIAGVMLQGLQRFRVSSLNSVAEPALRFLFVALLIRRFELTGYLLAVFLGGLAAIGITAGGLREFIGKTKTPGESYYEDLRGMWAYAWPVAIMIVAGSVQGFIEPFVVKHFLSSADAAGFFMVSRFGYIPSYLIGPVAFVLFPVLSYRHRRGEKTADYLGQALLVAALVSGAATMVLGSSARWIFGLRPEWRQFQVYAPYVWRMGFIATLTAGAGVYAMHEIAARRFSFLWIAVPLTVFEVVFLYCSLGFGAFRSMMPAATWEAISVFFPRSLGYVMWVMLAARVAVAFGLAIDWRVNARRRSGGTVQ